MMPSWASLQSTRNTGDLKLETEKTNHAYQREMYSSQMLENTRDDVDTRYIPTDARHEASYCVDSNANNKLSLNFEAFTRYIGSLLCELVLM